MGEDNIIDLITKNRQANFIQLALGLINEALNDELTKQIVINVSKGTIIDIRNNEIIAGATIVDFRVQNL